jgi:uncharacterized protein (TIGR00375 family)
MQFICDFHIHSKYSRATAKNISVEELAKWAQIKGVNVLGTGDFTHPIWFKELKEKLESAEEQGLYKLKSKFQVPSLKNNTRFILTTEISSIYTKNNKTRKIHNLIFAPSFEVVEKINTQLGWIGNLKSDGRPILGLDAKELAKIIFNISQDCMIVPAHAWTPWFSIFGHFSGFDSIEECFEEYAKNIFAIETGLSSDPEMNWSWSKLDHITLISNSDAHSPSKIAREANVFQGEKISYNLIRDAIMKKSDELKLVKTIEFFPEEGKYHWDGHRLCGIVLNPEDSLKYNNLCPHCGKMLTIGVANRVMKLSDRKQKEKSTNAVPFVKIIPLEELVADVLKFGVGAKAVKDNYNKLIKIFGNELKILLEVKKEEIIKAGFPEIAEGIERVRQGNIQINPGYDGEFGKINIFGENEQLKITKTQETLWTL